ncbi:STYKc [Musa troglodytarum]|uniref:non-specific serine/threonine protein kinase n=1 Tax=Musa troglodytarum TaxID=320322 RepID=A0A9E7K790_9LILI|nr:STYKc [Musa troglodytarum]URE07072.1 STYKc [Musa troglodytarum]
MEMTGDSALSEQGTSSSTWWSSDFVESLQSVSLDPREETACNIGKAELSCHTASQILWSTGTFSGSIPNGFYSVIPDKKLKELYETIPSPDDIYSLGMEGFKADIILVDADKDKKLCRLKQLSAAMVKGLHSNPALLIKKIAGLCVYVLIHTNGTSVDIVMCCNHSDVGVISAVGIPNHDDDGDCEDADSGGAIMVIEVFDAYKRPTSELSPAKAAAEDISHWMDNKGVQLLGQIRHGSCRPRAILFKVLADSVGLESKLVVGLPSDGGVECADSYRHMSVVVTLNSVELLVDLMRFPGQLIPFSTKAIFISHISAAGESDSAENDSCDSPLEPNSPLYGLPDKLEAEGPEQDENPQSLYQRRVDASSNLTGPTLRNIMLRSTTFTERKLSASHSEPNIANAIGRHSHRKAVAGQLRTASSSPEHPLSRARGRSILSGDRQLFREYTDGVVASRSDGASTSDVRRIRRRSISITPEIGDDIVRAVRAMNETLKQNRLLRDSGDESSCLFSTKDKNQLNDPPNNVEAPFQHSGAYNSLRKQSSSNQKAISLPSSPHEYGSKSTERNGDSSRTEDMVLTWNKVLQSSSFLNKPLLPFEEWNIDFSELTVGTRVGIGKLSCSLHLFSDFSFLISFFGEVFRGIWNGTDVAIKVFLEQDLTTENMEDFCNEIYILSRLRHPNVILFLGACMKPPHLSMVTEYMEMGSLYYLMHMSGQKKKLSWRKRLKMLRDICRGLMCMHRMKIVHRDLKSANCLVDKHWTVKICDFGLSQVMIDGPLRDNSSAGTPEWMAPELIRNEPFTEKCDIFSLGVIIWELCTLNRPWEGIPSVQVIYSVANEGTRLEIPEGPLGKLISDCWAEPHERPSCQEILARLLDCEYTLS